MREVALVPRRLRAGFGKQLGQGGFLILVSFFRGGDTTRRGRGVDTRTKRHKIPRYAMVLGRQPRKVNRICRGSKRVRVPAALGRERCGRSDLRPPDAARKKNDVCAAADSPPAIYVFVV